MTARGLRNCNPLNIEKGTDWQGLTADQPDERFCTFKTVPYGYRAAVKILDNYQRLHSLWTIRGIINRWAPPGENDTGAYVGAIANACGVSADETFALKHGANTRNILRAMTIHENGSCPYADTVIEKGISLARGDA